MKLIKSLIPYIIVIIIVMIVRTFVITPVKVNGTSMYPTLDGGEIMLLNKLDNIERFDIVVVDLKDGNENIIKRVIGLPGETVKIMNNRIYINDEVLKDDYGLGETSDINKIKLEEGEYFVLGDNRKISLDSRVFGKIKASNIKGTADFVIFPFNKIGKVK